MTTLKTIGGGVNVYGGGSGGGMAGGAGGGHLSGYGGVGSTTTKGIFGSPSYHDGMEASIHALNLSGDTKKKLVELMSKAPKTGFNPVSRDEIIDILGNEDPMDGPSLSSLSEGLLRCSPEARSSYDKNFDATGMFYTIPYVFGKTTRIRTSYVGLGLLDHWADKSARFSAFVDAYVTLECREQIAHDSFIFGMGKMPQWIKDEIKHGEELQQRYAKKAAREQAVKTERQRAELNEMYERQRAQSQLGDYMAQQMTWTAPQISTTAIPPVPSYMKPTLGSFLKSKLLGGS